MIDWDSVATGFAFGVIFMAIMTVAMFEIFG